jgi:hypothetical protein
VPKNKNMNKGDQIGRSRSMWWRRTIDGKTATSGGKGGDVRSSGQSRRGFGEGEAAVSLGKGRRRSDRKEGEEVKSPRREARRAAATEMGAALGCVQRRRLRCGGGDGVRRKMKILTY